MSRKKKSKAKVVHLSPENYIKQKARTLPIYKCYITPEWDDAKMANIIIGRKHVNGNITLGGYLVDLLCKGVKNSMYYFNIDIDDFEEMIGQNEFTECDYALAHNVVYAGLEFGEDNGFLPHKDFRISEFVLEEDDSVELIDIHVGNDEGKPFLAEQDPIIFQRDLKILEKTLGSGNFEFLREIDDKESFDDFEELDDDEDFDEDKAEEIQQEIFTHLSYDILFPQDTTKFINIIDFDNIIESHIPEFDEKTTIQTDDFFDIIEFENERINECSGIALQIIDKYPEPEIFPFFIDALNYEHEDKAQILIDKMSQEYPDHVFTLYYQLLSSIENNNTFDIEIIFNKIQSLKYIKTPSSIAIYICLSHIIYHLYFDNLQSANTNFIEALHISNEYDSSLLEMKKISQEIFSRKTDAIFDKLETLSDEESKVFEQKMKEATERLEENLKTAKSDD